MKLTRRVMYYCAKYLRILAFIYCLLILSRINGIVACISKLRRYLLVSCHSKESIANLKMGIARKVPQSIDMLLSYQVPLASNQLIMRC